MFHSKLKETLNHSIAKVTSDRDSFVSHPEKDFCVVRELSPEQIILSLSS